MLAEMMKQVQDFASQARNRLELAGDADAQRYYSLIFKDESNKDDVKCK